MNFVPKGRLRKYQNYSIILKIYISSAKQGYNPSLAKKV